MKASYILLIAVGFVVIAAVAYMFTAAESPEAYVEKKSKKSGSGSLSLSDLMSNHP